MTWNPDKKALLSKMWTEGASIITMVETLQNTRSAVCAQARRMDLPMRRPGKNSTSLKLVPVVRAIQVRPVAPSRPIPVEPPPEQRISFWQLKTGLCKYPYGEPLHLAVRFCGQQTGGQTYCPLHHALCLEPLKASEAREVRRIRQKFWTNR